MIRLTALSWVPDMARGRVRDYRIRWALREAGLAYEVRRVDFAEKATAGYRALQPFEQVPAYEEDGVRLFETGAILLHIAETHGVLLPPAGPARARALSWLFAAANSIDPAIFQLFLLDHVAADKAAAARLRPEAAATLRRRLEQAEAALGDEEHVAGDFSIADIMLASTLHQVDNERMFDDLPRLGGHFARSFARPACREAIAEQIAGFDDDPPAAGDRGPF